MWIKILSLLIILSALGASFLEGKSPVSEHLESEELIAHHIQDSKDCSGDDCHDGDNCCECFCPCTLSFILNENTELSFSNKPLLTKQPWYLYINYRQPFLDPGLKPPLFS